MRPSALESPAQWRTIVGVSGCRPLYVPRTLKTWRRVSYGTTDELELQAVEKPVYCYDLHATVLHLLGIDHARLTFRHNGIDRRLTDVHGHVMRELVA